MTDGSFEMIVALIRKLGGEVEITTKELIEAADFEIETCQTLSFTQGHLVRARQKPITIDGELANELTE